MAHFAVDPPIYVIAGLPGAGKSTTARALADRFPASVHVEADRLQAMIVNGVVLPEPDGIGPDARAQLDLRLVQACGVARTFAEAGFVAVLDDLVIGSALPLVRRELEDCDWRFVMLCPDFEHVRRRWLAIDSPFADSWGWIDDVIRDRTERIGLWLDSTELGVEEVVDRILAHDW